MDASLFLLINGAHVPAVDDLMLLASAVGRAGFVWFATAAIAAVFPARRMGAWRLVLAVGFTYLMVDGVLKPLLPRERPFEVLAEARLIDQRPVTSSFPSGHAAAAVAGALAASRLLPEARIAWWVLAAAIAISRVYVGAHWPSDVMAGAVIGFALGWFALGGRRVSLTNSPAALPSSPTT